MNDYEKTQEFLGQQQYMTLAVVLSDGSPWVTPVKLQKWDGNDFEWDSVMTTEHSKAIEAGSKVAVSMYSRNEDPFGQFGVYLTGTAVLVSSNDKGIGRYRFTADKAYINDATFRKREVEL